MNRKIVIFYRSTFLLIIGLFVLLIDIAHFDNCIEGSCLTLFITLFNLIWFIIFFILFDMYRNNWGNFSKQIRNRGFYWFGWFMIVIGPLAMYMFSYLPLVMENYDYREYMTDPRSEWLGVMLQGLGNRFGFWLPTLIVLLIGVLIMYVGYSIVRKKHSYKRPIKCLNSDANNNTRRLS